MKEAKAEVIKKFGRGIKRAFRSVTTYALPHPGPNITRSSDDGKTKVRVNFVGEWSSPHVWSNQYKCTNISCVLRV